MRRWARGLVVAAVHVALVSALGAKLLYDRATLPRAWVQTAPVDPRLPIRGRYVELRMAVTTQGIAAPPLGSEQTGPTEPSRPATPDASAAPARPPPLPRSMPPRAVQLRLEGDRLVAVPAEEAEGSAQTGARIVSFVRDVSGEVLAVIDPPLAFFIPEDVPDPSVRPQGETLWVEVTVPKDGPPRPIRLGVRRNGGQVEPLESR